MITRKPAEVYGAVAKCLVKIPPVTIRKAWNCAIEFCDNSYGPSTL